MPSRTILHIDGDSFFASCEQSLNPSLRGKPVVVGKERGIAVAYSQEAKNKGVTRGMQIHEVKKLVPDVVILSSDYETYQLFSRRFYSIVRRYTSEIEEYSIDECFADITGLDQLHHLSYEELALSIQKNLKDELGCTFSIGLGSTKTLAKIGSNWKKPEGFTHITSHTASHLLGNLPIQKVWGIGPQTALMLQKNDIRTALQFIHCQESWIQSHLSKPFYETWKELRGIPVLLLETKKRPHSLSIQKTKTFSPSSREKDVVFSELSHNIEQACVRARKFRVAAQQATFLLRTKDFQDIGIKIALSRPTAFPNKIIHLCEKMFSEIFNPRLTYRSTGVILSKLTGDVSSQLDLFGTHLEVEKLTRLYKCVDVIDQKYGKQGVYLGASLHARSQEYEYAKNAVYDSSKRLSIPLFGAFAV